MRCLAPLLLTGCLSFQAVTSTAQLGVTLPEKAEVLQGVGAWCNATNAKQDAPLPACAETIAAAEKWQAAVFAIASYAHSLKALAKGEDLQVDERLNAALAATRKVQWHRFAAERSNAASAAIGGLVDVFTAESRRVGVSDAVEAADAHVQLLCETIAQHVATQLENLGALDDYVARLLTHRLAAPKGLEAQAATLPLRRYQHWLALERGRLSALDKGLRAFAKAHAILKRDAAELGKRDTVIYTEILQTVNAVYAQTTGSP